MKKNFLTCCILLLALFFTACSSQGANGAVGTRHPTMPPIAATLDPTHLLQKSKIAMARLQSVHFEIEATTQPETASAGSSATLLQAFQPLPGTTYMQTDGSGDMIAPDLSRLDLTQTVKEASPGKSTFHTIIQNDDVYLPGADKSWYMISKKTLLAADDTRLYAQAGFSQVSSLLDLSLQKGTLHDNGTATLGGKYLHHVQATFQKDAFPDLQALDIENTTWPRPALAQFSNIADTTDFWIDDTTGYIYQAVNTLKLDPVKVQTLGFHCSAFNQPVTIQVPAHATPVNSIDQIPFSPGGN